MPSHPRHASFLGQMCDPRLRDPISALNDLSQYAVGQEAGAPGRR